MRVAIFTDTFIPQVNGVAGNTGRLADALTKREIPCMVLSPDTGYEGGQGYNVYFTRRFSFPAYPECKIALPNYLKMCRQLDLFKPDLIHLVTQFSIGLCGLRYACSTSIPVISSYHTNFPQYLSYYRLAFLTPWVWKYFRWFHNKCLKNYCPSETTMKLLKENGIRNLDLCGSGVDIALFNPNKRSPAFISKIGADNKTILLYVGRLAKEKDLDMLMEAVRVLNNSFQDICLVVTGDGPLTKTLKRNAPENVIFTGYLNGEELAEAYASSDIFVFPSTTETYGNVILEAMASGLPVVAPYSGGIQENLIDKYNGLTCRPRNYGDIVAAVTMLKENDQLREALGNQARTFALKKSWDKILGDLITDYFELVKNNMRKLQ
ncbi:MAG: GDP-mannose-dependent alpha-mannosyltransferase [Pelotomaculum sp. PtaB.Bin013]|uniref:Glycosyltransferase family 1 protein n=1 Tax=Pelotomaculum isophthalicicum JI TaxID=947010 RepID=A0A9X4JTJ7_9FIRM|nr:glycosyltransferase family 1 protein [Pelotomaculum isophthalicicum]MDF9408874.1 glycosyltransferase family 1 protein [Pelotomaculum isophthalicicum JI]OPX89233.1 MAG: GDP-mannose-dependent alpha-mannosyltransferase [Pelotomaculum sp. PtaB.Bin013]